MFRIEGVREIDSQKNAVMDIQVSTASDLPSLGDLVSGAGYVNIKVAAGSFAQIIQTGDFVTLDANGTWYPEPSDSRSLSAPSLTKTLETEQTEREQNETEQEKPEDDEPAEREPIEQPVKEQKKTFEESIEEPEKDGEDDAELL